MLPQLAEATTGKNSILLENSGNIWQWCVTFAGIGMFARTIAMTK